MNLKSIFSLLVASIAVVEAKKTVKKHGSYSQQKHLRAALHSSHHLQARFGDPSTLSALRDDIHRLIELLNRITNPSVAPAAVAGYAPRVWGPEYVFLYDTSLTPLTQ